MPNKKRNNRKINFCTPKNTIKVTAKAEGRIFFGKMPNVYGVVKLANQILPVFTIKNRNILGCKNLFNAFTPKVFWKEIPGLAKQPHDQKTND